MSWHWNEYHEAKNVPFDELEGKTLEKCFVEDEELRIETTGGERYKLYHIQDCCEQVYIEDICGRLSDLVGSPILKAEEVLGDLPPKSEWDNSYTWTFYKIATVKGCVTIRWYGTSSGYYSETVDFVRYVGGTE